MSLNKHIEVFSTPVEVKVFSQIHKDSAGGSDTPANHMTGNLLKTEYGNNEEQQTMSNDSLAEEKLRSAIKLTNHSIAPPDEGVRQQIDSHPPPLPPVEEEMHTKPSQHAHVHTDEDVEMSPVALMDQVPRPLASDDKLLDQEAMVAGNVAVGGEQASMDEATIEGDQGQGQMVEQCGDVTVVEACTSPSYLEGTVQVCCNNKPNKPDAMVECRDLNLNYNSDVALCKAYFGAGPGSILLDHAIGVQTSLNPEDVGVRCGVVFMGNDILDSGNRGDQYVTICADTWSNIEASCQQPGYPPYVAITVVKGVLGGTTNSISSISGFACNGAEPSLSACPVVTGASVPCSLATSGQLRDVTKAGNCTHGDIRLVMSQINGPLKVCISIAWGTMCSEQVTSREVACKQLNASEPNIRVNATEQQLLKDPPYTLDVTMVCNKPDISSNLTYAQPLQQALYGQGTNGSLVPMSTSIGTVSELFFLQCSIVLTTCNHSHDASVKYCTCDIMIRVLTCTSVSRWRLRPGNGITDSQEAVRSEINGSCEQIESAAIAVTTLWRTKQKSKGPNVWTPDSDLNVPMADNNKR
eukprot:Em0010g556a